MLLLPSHRLRRRRFHNGRWSVFTYGWLRRHCDQTRPPPDRRAGADRRRRALGVPARRSDRKSTRLYSSHLVISYAVFCLKKKNYFTKFLLSLLSSQSIAPL